ncbi:MAG: four-carbon acid sugar kinase family protein [Planctomycetota bacterium]|jgi:uncharacterized protein YgbK (DUF1537 family)
MIAVIADDFTGAAEIGAISLRFGLSAKVQTQFYLNSKADLLVIDTDTRSRTKEQAAAEVEKVFKELQKVCPEWIYKKVDSVMRGHTLAELAALLSASNKQRALLVPANPSMGRTISNGRYFIDSQPLNETDFANDPEYPAASSDVLQLLDPRESLSTHILQCNQPITAIGTIVGEAETKEDLLFWASALDHQTIPAGAADFFAAILEAKGFHVKPPKKEPEFSENKTALFICASGSTYTQRSVQQAQSHGIPISKMPPELFEGRQSSDKSLQQWSEDTVTALQRHSKLVVTIGQPITENRELALKLRHHIAALVANILSRTSIDELLIEGGATASAIVRRLKWTRFFPCAELAPGVVRMRIEEKTHPYLTIKPGSYPWPEKLWRP